MRDGFIKAAVGTPEIKVADCRRNAEQTFQFMRQADARGVHLLVLPELGLTGSTCGDLFCQRTLLEGAAEALGTVLEATRHLSLVAVVGLPLRKDNRLYNCAAVISDGKVLGVVPQERPLLCSGPFGHPPFRAAESNAPPPERADMILLPGGIAAPFGARLLFCCRTLPAFTFGVVVGANLQTEGCRTLAAAGATVIANPSAGCALVGAQSRRRSHAAEQSRALVCGILSAEAGEGESSTDLVFAGHNLIVENGALLGESRFETGLVTSELDVFRLEQERLRTGFRSCPNESENRIWFSLPLSKTNLTRYLSRTPFVPEDKAERAARCEEVLLIASMGLKKRLDHTGAKTAVLGLSGGLDSTLAMLITMIAMKLLGRQPEEVVAVTMPCFGTTDRTRDNAVELAERLGATLRRIDISDTVRSHFSDIGQSMDKYDAAFENAQARERTQVLMDIADQTGGIVVGSADLTELALGDVTYNGDQASLYGVNASIPKTLVRHLVQYVSRDKAEEDEALSVVLTDILDTPGSSELIPAGETKTGSAPEPDAGPWELYDFFLYYMLRWAFPPAKILRLAEYAFGRKYQRAVLLSRMKRFYERFFSQQFMRSALADGPKIGSVSLSPRGFGFQMPSDAAADLWLAELDNLD